MWLCVAANLSLQRFPWRVAGATIELPSTFLPLAENELNRSLGCSRPLRPTKPQESVPESTAGEETGRHFSTTLPKTAIESPFPWDLFQELRCPLGIVTIPGNTARPHRALSDPAIRYRPVGLSHANPFSFGFGYATPGPLWSKRMTTEITRSTEMEILSDNKLACIMGLQE